MKKRNLLMMCLFFLVAAATGQKKITLEDIFRSGSFRTKGIPGFRFMNDGKSYISLSEGNLKQMNITDGKESAIILTKEEFKRIAPEGATLNDFELSADESKILFKIESEAIYRRSSRDKVLVYDRKTGKSTIIHNGDPINNATFSPDATKIAYTYKNDLYYTDLADDRVTLVTNDGKWNSIINGMCDWVYEEEFSFTRAFEWSGDGNSLAYLRFDESLVPELTLEYYHDGMYPEPYTYKYPKVGEKNSTVTVHFFNLDTKKTAALQLPPDGEIYYPRLKWTRDANQLCVFRMNRHQNELNLLLVDRNTGNYTTLLHETSLQYIEINDFLTFFKNGKEFLWVSDQEGFQQVYLYQMDGKLKNKITTGQHDISDIYGVDEKNRKLYYQVVAPTPMDRQVGVIDLSGKNDLLLSAAVGTSAYNFTGTYEYAVSTWSDLNTPPVYQVLDKKGKVLRVLEDNATAKEKFSSYGAPQTEFFNFTSSEGVSLNGWMIKPDNFDPNKKYPVFMTLYGGPGSQQVLNSWSGGKWWFKMFAQQGYLIACVDNRGTGGRGTEFRKMTYLQMGHYETIDQIEAAKYLGKLPYVDAGRIGIFGWSYGGFMSSLCLFKGNDVFKSALAVAPVTNWKWYDSIYTERYMRTEAENPKGFAENSPIYFADRLRGNYFLAHGMADDNVHFQNSVEMNRSLIKAGKDFEFHMYPNSNHGIFTEGATFHLYSAMTKFVLEKI